MLTLKEFVISHLSSIDAKYCDDVFELHVRFWKRKSEAEMCAQYLSLWEVCVSQESYILAKQEGLLENGPYRKLDFKLYCFCRAVRALKIFLMLWVSKPS